MIGRSDFERLPGRSRHGNGTASGDDSLHERSLVVRTETHLYFSGDVLITQADKSDRLNARLRQRKLDAAGEVVEGHALRRAATDRDEQIVGKGARHSFLLSRKRYLESRPVERNGGSVGIQGIVRLTAAGSGNDSGESRPHNVTGVR